VFSVQRPARLSVRAVSACRACLPIPWRQAVHPSSR
jgi:hypothetical protein